MQAERTAAPWRSMGLLDTFIILTKMVFSSVTYRSGRAAPCGSLSSEKDFGETHSHTASGWGGSQWGALSCLPLLRWLTRLASLLPVTFSESQTQTEICVYVKEVILFKTCRCNVAAWRQNFPNAQFPKMIYFWWGGK